MGKVTINLSEPLLDFESVPMKDQRTNPDTNQPEIIPLTMKRLLVMYINQSTKAQTHSELIQAYNMGMDIMKAGDTIEFSQSELSFLIECVKSVNERSISTPLLKGQVLNKLISYELMSLPGKSN